MEEKTKNILKRLIETVIMPMYPEIKRVYRIDPIKQQSGRVYFLVTLEVTSYKNKSEISREIDNIFTMSGLNKPSEDTLAYEYNLLDLVIVDFF